MTSLFLFLALQSGEPDIRRSMAAGEKDAFVMLPPETVCGADADELTWTPDGKTLIVRRSAVSPSASEVSAALSKGEPLPRPKSEIIVWDVASRRARTVLSVPSATVEISTVQPMPSTDRIVFDLRERIPGVNDAESRTVDSIGIVALGSGLLTRIVLPNGTLGGATISPTRPLGMIRVLERNRGSSVRFFGPDARLGSAVSFPDRRTIFFDATGQPAFEASEESGPMLLQRIDPTTGKVVEKVKLPPPTRMKDGTLMASPEATAMTTPGFHRADGPQPLLTAVSTGSFAPHGTQGPTVVLSVRGGKKGEFGIVSTDGSMPALSPANNAVAYIDQGSAMVRLLTRVPREAYDKALIDAAKRDALNKAKQIGLGLLQFAADHDDMLPGADADLRQKIGPYLKNDHMLDGFSYTYRGGNLLTIEAIATTELGSVSSPGGRAVVYTDGHAKWIPDGS